MQACGSQIVKGVLPPPSTEILFTISLRDFSNSLIGRSSMLLSASAEAHYPGGGGIELHHAGYRIGKLRRRISRVNLQHRLTQKPSG